MAQKQLAMNIIRQVLQLHQQQIPIREIARRTGISRNSVKKYLKINDQNNQDVPLNADAVYFSENGLQQVNRSEELEAFFKLYLSDLSRTGVTRQVLWKEYIALHPNGYGYSQFCHYISNRLELKDLSMHLEYSAGDMMMVDFAGKKVYYTDRYTGEVIPCEVFVGILPFSGMIFCKVVASQKSEDFCTCINDMLRFYGGVPSTILCDNLKTAVIKSCRYEPLFTELCNQLSDHYGTSFSATRPHRPKDKAMVEGAVKIVYQNIYAPLRNNVYHSLADLNRALTAQLEILNLKLYKKTLKSRKDYFVEGEQQKLLPLPSLPYELKKVVTLTVQRNYHVQLSETRRYYSVPYLYVGKKVKVLYNRHTIEVYYDQQRIAFHTHNKLHYEIYTTDIAHMPPNHQRMKQINGWNQEDLLSQAKSLGEDVYKVAELILTSNTYMEQNYKSCFGLLMLAKKYNPQRLQGACKRALGGTRVNYTMIKNILHRSLDKQPDLFTATNSCIPDHENIRGKDNYQ